MLIKEMMTDCTMMDRVSVPDGMGGFSYIWQDGAQFEATIIKDQTIQARVAENAGMSEVYTVVVSNGVQLDFKDVFKRLEDGAVFRVTSNIKDSVAPQRSTVQIGKVTAERWEIPND